MISRQRHPLITLLLNLSFPNKLSIFLFISFLFYATFSLSLQEIQPFDEGYYALRAAAIAANPTNLSLWISQEAFSIKGFYSASHPPLMIWMMTISVLILGESEFALRLPMWICFLGSGIFLVRILFISVLTEERDQLPEFVGWSLLLFFLTPFAFWFGKSAMLESGAMLFSISQVYFYLCYEQKEQMKSLILSGICLGLGLLSKSLVCFFPAFAILIHGIFFTERSHTLQRRFIDLVLFFSIGIFIGGSWLLANQAYDPDFFVQFFKHYFSERMLINQTGAIQHSGYFYYVNLFAVRFPLAFLSLFWFFRFFKDPPLQTPFRKFLLAWVMIPFVILTLSSTKLLWYGLIIFPPMVLITAESVLWLIEHKRIFPALLFLLPVLMWSFFQPLAAFRSIDAFQYFIQSNQFLGVAGLIAFCLALYFSKRIADGSQHRSMLRMVLLVVLMLWSYTTSLNGLSLIRLFGGMKEITRVINTEKIEMLLYVTEERKISVQGGINPQRTYYWRGNDPQQTNMPLPNAARFHCTTIGIASFAFMDYDINLKMDTMISKPFAVIVEKPSDEEVRYQLSLVLPHFEKLNNQFERKANKRHLKLKSYDLYY
ncbi:MAG: glycosyltransferase family 39 protein [Chloroherpetonaceae bacterium]|nr:glycosyltransferase family 39 protein [Chloroherpetonaceae bacterium]